MSIVIVAPADAPTSVVAGLQSALEAAQKLEAAGSKVIGSYANPRRMVLLVDHAPPFVQGHCKARFPNHLCGYSRLYAAPYHGVQIEWMVDEPGYVQAVGHV